MTVFPPSSQNAVPTVTLAVLDTTAWSLRTIAAFSSPSLGTWRLSLSPDGKYALFYNQRFRSDPYTPTVDKITMATGQVTAMPHLAQAMGPESGFTSLAWRADDKTIAASSGFDENGDLKTWVLDLARDNATQLQLQTARYIAGWAPNNGPLLLTSGWQGRVNGGPYTISSVSIGAGGQASETVLTQAAMTFPFLGFVRTA